MILFAGKFIAIAFIKNKRKGKMHIYPVKDASILNP